jgi:hypothetical protein
MEEPGFPPDHALNGAHEEAPDFGVVTRFLPGMTERNSLRVQDRNDKNRDATT